MKYRHYAPSKPLILVEDLTKMEEVLKKYPNHVVICVDERKELYDDIIVVGSLKIPTVSPKTSFLFCEKQKKGVKSI